MKAAIVGLGLIGSEWARHLNSDGILAATWNRTPREFSLFESKLESIPAKADIIHTVVSDEKAAFDVISKLVPHLEARHLVVQSTTIDAATSEKCKDLVEATGAKYLEAPFTGSLLAAKDRKTVFYLGGSSELIEFAMPYLRHVSQQQFVLGTNTQACTFKLSMNLQISGVMAALAEGLTICRRAGISDDAFFSAFKGNASFSGVAALKEPKLKTDDFSPQFSVKHMSKDMRLLSDAGGNAFPVLTTVRQVLSRAEREGLSDLDFSAIIKLLA